jgi:predicted amidohydrolase
MNEGGRKMQRRQFLKSSAGALAGLGLGRAEAGTLGNNGLASAPLRAAEGKTPPVGRPVRVVSIGLKEQSKSLEEVVAVVDIEGGRGADVIALPEAWRGQKDQNTEETLLGPTITAMAVLARKHRTYIVCPIDRKDGDKRLNTAVLLDRDGQVATVYNKVYPWTPEFLRLKPPVNPGEEVGIHQADFGKLGVAICFDIDFPEVWHQLANQGAELVIWPSAYSGGNALKAHALQYHYYIVTATQAPDCTVFDITGDEILYQKSDGINVSRITLDLDRGVYDRDAIDGREKCTARREKLFAECGDDVEEEKYMEREDWFVLRAKRPGVSSREIARSYGLVEKAELVRRARKLVDDRRGWAFSQRVLSS